MAVYHALPGFAGHSHRSEYDAILCGEVGGPDALRAIEAELDATSEMLAQELARQPMVSARPAGAGWEQDACDDLIEFLESDHPGCSKNPCSLCSWAI